MSHFPNGLTPREGQRNVLLDIEARFDEADVFVINAPTACHGKGERVLLCDGTSIAVEDVIVGDKLLGPDGTARTVLATTSGTSSLYRITPQRSAPFIVTGNHILPLKVHKRRGGKRDRVPYLADEERTVEEYLNESKSFKHCAKLWRPAGIDFIDAGKNELELDPYILGIWLGDGTSSSASITSMDIPVIEAFCAYYESRGCRIRTEHLVDNKSNTYHAHRVAGGRPGNMELKSLGVLNNKHIPHKYLISSREDRLNLIAGLIDTDGHVMKEKCSIEYSSCRESLLDDFLYLAWSLGFSGNKKVKYVKGIPYWRCAISGQRLEDIPLRVTHKKEALANSHSNQNNRAFSVEEIGVGEYYGFTVDKDHLYLLPDFTVTHNCGKTAISLTIQRWLYKHPGGKKYKSAFILPNNLLLDQVKESNKRLHTLHKMSHYDCPVYIGENCETIRKDKELCQKCSNCPYLKAVRRSHVVPYMACNTHTFMAHKIRSHALILDEAHLLKGVIQERASRRLWHHEYDIPTGVNSYGSLLRWAESVKDKMPYKNDKKFKLLYGELIESRHKYLVQKAIEPLRGEDRFCLRLLPMDIKEHARVLWPAGKAEKIFLMSATINEKDIEELGLDGRRVGYFHAESPIPPENRPCAADFVGNMSYRSQERNLPKAVERIKERLSETMDKGLVHMPYSMVEKLKESGAFKGNSRILFHDKENKLEVFHKFKELPADSGAVLIASGLYEGVSLDHDLARWQIICKVPYPSLADPAIKYKAENDPDWYAWETIKVIEQAAGRVCRTPDDFGLTEIIDSSFRRLHDDNEHLFDEWFKEAVIWV